MAKLHSVNYVHRLKLQYKPSHPNKFTCFVHPHKWTIAEQSGGFFCETRGVTTNSPIMTRAGTAFHSSQKVMKDEVTKMIPGIKTVVK